MRTSEVFTHLKNIQVSNFHKLLNSSTSVHRHAGLLLTVSSENIGEQGSKLHECLIESGVSFINFL